MAKNTTTEKTTKVTALRLLSDLPFRDLGLNIYQYVTFHSLLEAYFNQCKQQDRRYSYRYFSQRLGSKSPSFTKEVLDGKQKVNERLFTEFTEMLDLQGDEFDYFESLYRLEQYPEGTSLHERYYRRFRELRFRKPVNLVEAQYDCITSWFTWLIREVASLKGSQDNPLWFKRCINPILEKNVPDIVEAMDLLKSVQLLESSETGLSVPDPLKEMSAKDPRLKLLYKELIELALKYLKDTSKNREFGAFAIATTPEKYAQMKKDLKEFLDSQFLALDTPAGEATTVVSFSFQLLKLAQTHG